mmetsp:Transcript_27074/g.71221  ORF Transcript_27074/g.71221 Transcript_27074/m.71221 type:complete len:141 (+) Transcript_27074:95-517(+)
MLCDNRAASNRRPWLSESPSSQRRMELRSSSQGTGTEALRGTVSHPNHFNVAVSRISVVGRPAPRSAEPHATPRRQHRTDQTASVLRDDLHTRPSSLLHRETTDGRGYQIGQRTPGMKDRRLPCLSHDFRTTIVLKVSNN